MFCLYSSTLIAVLITGSAYRFLAVLITGSYRFLEFSTYEYRQPRAFGPLDHVQVGFLLNQLHLCLLCSRVYPACLAHEASTCSTSFLGQPIHTHCIHVCARLTALDVNV